VVDITVNCSISCQIYLRKREKKTKKTKDCGLLVRTAHMNELTTVHNCICDNTAQKSPDLSYYGRTTQPVIVCHFDVILSANNDLPCGAGADTPCRPTSCAILWCQLSVLVIDIISRQCLSVSCCGL